MAIVNIENVKAKFEAGDSPRSSDYIDMIDTLAALPPSYERGNTASRPASPTIGDIYSNTQTGLIEVYSGATYGWEQVGVIASAVTGVVATNTPASRAYNNGAASIAFTPGNVPGRSYTVTSTPGSYTATGSASPITVTGLQSSTQYTYVVTSSNNYGSANSLASSAVTATTAPQAPTIDSLTAGNAQVSVAFTTGATGGSTITGFTATSSPGGFTGTGTSPITVSGLTNGTTYTFTVTATNANGSSTSAASNSVIPNPAPSVTGGTLTSDSTYYYRTFTESGTLTFADSPLSGDLLVIASGASSIYSSSEYNYGGGGAGGVLYTPNISINPQSLSIAIGAGGKGQGNNSTVTGENGAGFTTLTAIGGGRGGHYADFAAQNGGSGGGGNPTSGGFGLGTAGQGNNGGNVGSYGFQNYRPSAGGGGAGEAGQSPPDESNFQPGGRGGDGTSTYSSWGLVTSTGENLDGVVYYGGGAGGSSRSGGGGTGGKGGGRLGGSQNAGNTGNSPATTGGGAGMGNGGSGVVIFRYLKSAVG